MPEQIEIEFKNLLSATEYQQLIQSFDLSNLPPIIQENSYFDTATFDLKEKKAALRIRTKADRTGEITLKTPLQKGLLETNMPLTTEELSLFEVNQRLPDKKELADKLQSFGLNTADMRLFASLKTKRLEKQLSPDILLVLDESWYHGHHDYELEIEASSYELGEAFFLNLLQQHHIPKRVTPNKIQRATLAKDKQ